MTIGASVTAAADFPCCGRSRAKERELGKERLLDRERKTLLPRRWEAGRVPSQGEQPGSSHSAGRARLAAPSLLLLRRLHPLPGQTATACSGSAKDVKLQNGGDCVFFLRRWHFFVEISRCVIARLGKSARLVRCTGAVSKNSPTHCFSWNYFSKKFQMPISKQ